MHKLTYNTVKILIKEHGFSVQTDFVFFIGSFLENQLEDVFMVFSKGFIK